MMLQKRKLTVIVSYTQIQQYFAFSASILHKTHMPHQDPHTAVISAVKPAPM